MKASNAPLDYAITCMPSQILFRNCIIFKQYIRMLYYLTKCCRSSWLVIWFWPYSSYRDLQSYVSIVRDGRVGVLKYYLQYIICLVKITICNKNTIADNLLSNLVQTQTLHCYNMFS